MRLMPGRWRTMSLLILILVLLAGCWPLTDTGPSGDTGNTQLTPTVESSGVAPGATGTADSGTSGSADPDVTALPSVAGMLNIAGQTNDPPTLDPALATDSYSLFVIRQLFSGLVAFDDKLNVVPDIAAALPQVSSDGKTYTFVLRKGVRFTDGQEVTSADVKYSMERATDPALAGSQSPLSLPSALYLGDIVGVLDKLGGKASSISGIKTPDPYTVEITIDQTKAYFLSKLTAGPAFVVQRSNVA